jgi:hypothetical protein
MKKNFSKSALGWLCSPVVMARTHSFTGQVFFDGLLWAMPSTNHEDSGANKPDIVPFLRKGIPPFLNVSIYQWILLLIKVSNSIKYISGL